MKSFLVYLLLMVALCRQGQASVLAAQGRSEGMAYALELLVDTLESPWGLAFVDEKRLLITEKGGSLVLFDPSEQRVVKRLAVPVTVRDQGQGGLLDVALGREGGWIYFTYSKPQGETAVTALARARLENDELVQWLDLIITRSRGESDHHYGSRIAFDGQGYLYFSVGDRGERDHAQDTFSHSGTILRLGVDGSVPKDNPFVSGGGLAEIYSFGHRNPQGLAYDSARNRLWSIEHGPRGGDELNLIVKGGNYGWPVVSHGMEYWGPVAVGQGTHKEGMIDPLKVYTPSIAPGSLLLYRGKAFPAWQDNLFAGALKLRHLNRVVLNEQGLPVQEERLLEDLGERIRALAEGPEGWLYLATDSGRLFRLRPLP